MIHWLESGLCRQKPVYRSQLGRTAETHTHSDFLNIAPRRMIYETHRDTVRITVAPRSDINPCHLILKHLPVLATPNHCATEQRDYVKKTITFILATSTRYAVSSYSCIEACSGKHAQATVLQAPHRLISAAGTGSQPYSCSDVFAILIRELPRRPLCFKTADVFLIPFEKKGQAGTQQRRAFEGFMER